MEEGKGGRRRQRGREAGRQDGREAGRQGGRTAGRQGGGREEGGGRREEEGGREEETREKRGRNEQERKIIFVGHPASTRIWIFAVDHVALGVFDQLGKFEEQVSGSC
jgi:hypothetical protein